MKRQGMKVAVAALVMGLAATSVPAAGPGRGGSGGWGMGGAYQRMYNPATVETVQGEVVAVNRIAPQKKMGPGLHLQLKSANETVAVHLGPAWYLERQDTRIEKGDTLEVTGSRVTIAGKPALIAQEVRKGDATLKLRDENGVPVWADWRQRP